MNKKREYREFLKSAFWFELSGRKKKLNPICERCGSDEELQAHHKFYRSNWLDTKIDDLESLCQVCHRAEHGIKKTMCYFGRCIIFREDERFSRILYWCHWLRGLGRELKQSELRYLKNAVKIYPPKAKDSCMKFHVETTLKLKSQ